jgi:integrase
MPRKVRETNLATRTARASLKARDKPYYRLLEQGLHLGYRRGQHGGKWVIRLYTGDQAYKVETLKGLPDDERAADGDRVLSYDQAQAAARQRRGQTGPYSVADAIAAYLAFLDSSRRGGYSARCSAEALILPELGSIAVATLTTARLNEWLEGLAQAPARLYSGKQAQRYRPVSADDEEGRRRRRSTANRIWTILRAALNKAWREGHVADDKAWRAIQTFRGADVARLRYLSADEARRLINTAQGRFRDLVQAALATGCRYGELSALKVDDFNAVIGRLHVRRSKTGKSRHVVLNAEGIALFTRLAAGRLGSDLLLPKDDGTAWRRTNQCTPIAQACSRAGIAPHANFHVLRHTYASHSIMAGAPLIVVAKNLGHANTVMVERHYGHLADDYFAQTVRNTAPSFGIEAAATTPVTPLGAKRAV